jgi:hypothetical protein
MPPRQPAPKALRAELRPVTDREFVVTDGEDAGWRVVFAL